MTNSVQVLPPGFRVLDSDGDPVSGAKIRFFEAGTSTPKEVFSDADLTVSLGSTVYTRSDGFPVSESGGSTTVMIYIGAGLYKVDIVDSSNVTIFPSKDNVQGAVPLTDDGTPVTLNPVVVVTGTSNAIDATYNGKLVIGNTSGGNVSVQLGAATVLGDGWNCRFKKSAAANTYTIERSGSDTIDGATTAVLTEQYDETDIYCDGAGFHLGARRVPFATNTAAITGTSTTVMLNPANVAAVLTDAIATQAQLETPTSAVKLVTPAQQKHHPSHPKGWAYVSAGGNAYTLVTGYNFASAADGGAGICNMIFTTAMASVNYAAMVQVYNNNAALRLLEGRVVTRSVTGFQVTILEDGATDGAVGVATDNVSFAVTVFGDMA